MKTTIIRNNIPAKELEAPELYYLEKDPSVVVMSVETDLRTILSSTGKPNSSTFAAIYLTGPSKGELCLSMARQSFKKFRDKVTLEND